MMFTPEQLKERRIEVLKEPLNLYSHYARYGSASTLCGKEINNAWADGSLIRAYLCTECMRMAK